MKLIEQRCPACSGTLKIDEKDPNIAVCEYCRSRYILQWEGDAAHIGREPGRQSQEMMRTRLPEKKSQSPARLIGAGLLAAALLLGGTAVIVQMGGSGGAKEAAGLAGEEAMAEGAGEEAGEAGKAFSKAGGAALPDGIFADFCQQVFGQPADTVTPDQLQKIRQMELRSAIDYYEIRYSMEDPMANPQAALTSVKFARDDYSGFDLSALPAFSGLEKLSSNQSLRAEDLEGLPLKSIGGGIVYVDWDDVNLVDHMDFLGNLGGLKKLSVQGNDLTDLSFASSLAALEEIDLSDNYVTDLTPLAGLKALKTVLCTENPISNYEVLKSSVTVLGDY